MQFSEISVIRLANQHLTLKKQTSVNGLIEYLGAIQGQDYHMAKWALGTRLNNSSESEVEFALNKGEILRTHLLRPTWHIVSAKNIYWMLELTAPQIRSAVNSRHRELEITNPEIAKISQTTQK